MTADNCHVDHRGSAAKKTRIIALTLRSPGYPPPPGGASCPKNFPACGGPKSSFPVILIPSILYKVLSNAKGAPLSIDYHFYEYRKCLLSLTKRIRDANGVPWNCPDMFSPIQEAPSIPRKNDFRR